MKIIKQWLESDQKDYNAGLELLRQHSKNRNLLNALSRKQLPQKLEYELRKIAGKSVFSATPKKVSVKKDTSQPVSSTSSVEKIESYTSNVERLKIVRNNRVVKVEELPQPLQDLYNANVERYKLARAAHEKLKLINDRSGEERAPIIAELEEYQNELRENWAVIDAWNPDKEVKENDTEEIDPKKVGRDRTYISRYKHKLETLEGAKKVEMMEKLETRAKYLLKVGVSIYEKTIDYLKSHGLNLE